MEMDDWHGASAAMPNNVIDGMADICHIRPILLHLQAWTMVPALQRLNLHY
jgi:hypothetical protein